MAFSKDLWTRTIQGHVSSWRYSRKLEPRSLKIQVLVACLEHTFTYRKHGSKNVRQVVMGLIMGQLMSFFHSQRIRQDPKAFSTLQMFSQDSFFSKVHLLSLFPNPLASFKGSVSYMLFHSCSNSSDEAAREQNRCSQFAQWFSLTKTKKLT